MWIHLCVFVIVLDGQGEMRQRMEMETNVGPRNYELEAEQEGDEEVVVWLRTFECRHRHIRTQQHE